MLRGNFSLYLMRYQSILDEISVLSIEGLTELRIHAKRLLY